MGALLAAAIASVAPANDRQDAVLDALVAGEQARVADDHGALLDAAQRLTALGARPVRGEADIMKGWTDAAQAGGTGLPPGAGYRGAALGPAYKRGVVGPGERYSLSQLFLAGQPARIATGVAGGFAGLTVQVRDGDGVRLCDKPVDPPRVECQWVPAYTGRFDIVVENRGSDRAIFFLVLR